MFTQEWKFDQQVCRNTNDRLKRTGASASGCTVTDLTQAVLANLVHVRWARVTRGKLIFRNIFAWLICISITYFNLSEQDSETQFIFNSSSSDRMSRYVTG